MAEIEMVIDSIRVSLMNYQRVVILKEKEGKKYLPIFIGPAEADAIAVKLQGVSVPRPLTHDFLCSVIHKLEGSVESAVINTLVQDTFYAKLVLKKDEERLEVDCRPSDALAIAVRLNTPIFTNTDILAHAGISSDAETGDIGGKPEELPGDMFKAIKKQLGRKQSPYEVFSLASQRILALATREAKRLNQNFVSTGHILLALVKMFSVANEVLKKKSDIDPAIIPQSVENFIREHTDIEASKKGLTSAVKETIKLSIEEAKYLHSQVVLPEHILLGLTHLYEGIANKLLKDYDVTRERIYIQIIRQSPKTIY